MLIGFFSILILFFVSLWVLSRDTGSRFLIGGVLISVFIPFEIFNTSFVGSYFSKISPFSFYCITVFLLYGVRKLIREDQMIADSSVMFGVAFLIYVAFVTQSKSGGRGFGTFIDNYFTPLCAFILLINEKEKIGRDVVDILIKIISIAALYGVIEASMKVNFLYGFVFENVGWISTQWNNLFHRSTSTIGHPLIAASIYIMAFSILNKEIKNYWLYVLVIGLGILSTGSRVAVVLMLFIILVRHIRFKQSKRNVIALSSMLALLIVGIFMGYFDQLIYRFLNGYGSTIVRIQLIEYLPEIIKISSMGSGVGSSGDVVKSIGFHNVIEIAWVALMIELGIWGLALLFITALLIMRRQMLWKGNILFVLVYFLMITSYNSISVHTPLVFLAVIFLFANRARALERSDEIFCSSNIHTEKV